MQHFKMIRSFLLGWGLLVPALSYSRTCDRELRLILSALDSQLLGRVAQKTEKNILGLSNPAFRSVQLSKIQKDLQALDQVLEKGMALVDKNEIESADPFQRLQKAILGTAKKIPVQVVDSPNLLTSPLDSLVSLSTIEINNEFRRVKIELHDFVNLFVRIRYFPGPLNQENHPENYLARHLLENLNVLNTEEFMKSSTVFKRLLNAGRIVVDSESNDMVKLQEFLVKYFDNGKFSMGGNSFGEKLQNIQAFLTLLFKISHEIYRRGDIVESVTDKILATLLAKFQFGHDIKTIRTYYDYLLYVQKYDYFQSLFNLGHLNSNQFLESISHSELERMLACRGLGSSPSGSYFPWVFGVRTWIEYLATVGDSAEITRLLRAESDIDWFELIHNSDFVRMRLRVLESGHLGRVVNFTHHSESGSSTLRQQLESLGLEYSAVEITESALRKLELKDQFLLFLMRKQAKVGSTSVGGSFDIEANSPASRGLESWIVFNLHHKDLFSLIYNRGNISVDEFNQQVNRHAQGLKSKMLLKPRDLNIVFGGAYSESQIVEEIKRSIRIIISDRINEFNFGYPN
jgi:hypothetical protein